MIYASDLRLLSYTKKLNKATSVADFDIRARDNTPSDVTSLLDAKNTLPKSASPSWTLHCLMQ